jgi:signal transduction histidine kinase/DNA-binding response OmpR family regulator
MTPPLHPLTLAFGDAALEARFRRTYTQDALPIVRWAILLGTFLYSVVFALNDLLMAGPVRDVALAVRGVFLVVGLGVFLWSFRPGFRDHWQGAMAAVLVTAGAGLMIPLALDPRPPTGGAAFGFNGPVLVILGTYVLFRLRFVWATAAGWTILLTFLIVTVALRPVPTGRILGSAIFFSAGNLVGMYAAYALERSARRLFAQGEALAAGHREVARLLNVRSRFFENVSHDLRTPLALIVGPLARLLEDPALPAPVRADLDVAERHATRLHRLVDALLELARLDAGHLPLRPAPGDLAAFVRGLTGAFASDAEVRGITLDVRTPETCPAAFDPDRLDRAVVNLVSNALKFTPPGGRVAVRLTCADDRAEVTVEDTGPGIAPAALAHVFDRFARAPDAEGTHGTGLGLALARELARLHGGDVTLASTPGQGTTARLWIPREVHGPRSEVQEEAEGIGSPEGTDSGGEALQAPVASLPDITAASVSDLEPRRGPRSEPRTSDLLGPRASDLPLVLVVDDSADVRAFVSRVLGEACTVEEAADGMEGLARARALVPDLVITDVMMPVLDGLGLVRAMRADPALDHVPVVVLTARAGEESRLEGFRAGVDDYLAKPFRPAELRARVENLVARQARLRARFEARVSGHPPSIEASPVVVTPADEAFVAQAQAAVEAALSDEHFGVDALAEVLCLSRRQTERKLRALTGVSPADFIRLIRLSRAASLLAQRYGTVSEVAYACGFPNASYFARIFREHYGTAPSEWTGR